ECGTLVGLGVEPALADLLAAIAQARADFPLRQGVALVANPVAAAAVAVAVAVVAMSVAGRGPRWRRGGFDLAEAQRRCAVIAACAVARAAAARRRGGRGRRCLPAAVGDAGAALPRATVVRPVRDPARIAFAVV